VVEMSLSGLLATGTILLALHLFAIAVTKALRSYSRSLLEERCARRGHPDRADEVAHLDSRTERSADTLAVLTGLLLAGLGGLGVARWRLTPAIEPVILIVLAIGLLGYVLAGVIGKVFAETIIDATWPASGFIRAAALPLTFGLRQVERLVEWLAGPAESLHRPASVEVEIAVSDEEDVPGDEEPDLPEDVREMLERTIELTRTDIAVIMTPRPMVVGLASTASAEEAAATFRRTGLSRIPVFGANHDDIIGILYLKDLFGHLTETGGFESVSPRKLVRPAFFVPETKNAFELLEEMRRDRRQIAVVLDEYGGMAGVVTLEDLLEELVGAIHDEHDLPAPEDPVRPLGDSRYEVDATLPVDSLNERLGLHLPTDSDYLTVGGLAFHSLGRVPEPGETFRADGVQFTVVDVKDHRIRRLRIDLVDAQPVGTRS
jgi:CBS domain containing-hemolysin-like protein